MTDARMFTLTPVPALRSRRRPRWIRVVVLGCVVVLVLLVITQFALPPLASKVVRDSLEPPDRGVSVSVSSFPAITLIFGHADSATVRMTEARPGGRGGLEKLLSRASHVNRLTANVETMYLGPLELRHAYLRKNGSSLTARATVTQKAIDNILPVTLHLNAADVSTGGLHLSLSTSVLGHPVSLGARLVARAGALEIAPELPLVGFVNVSVFNDPSVAVTAVSVEPSATGAYTFTVDGQYS
jgi:hypothetical protein